jgi:hypothetical protein
MDSSNIQGPFSVAPCQTIVSRFATFSSRYVAHLQLQRRELRVGGLGVVVVVRLPRGAASLVKVDSLLLVRHVQVRQAGPQLHPLTPPSPSPASKVSGTAAKRSPTAAGAGLGVWTRPTRPARALSSPLPPREGKREAQARRRGVPRRTCTAACTGTRCRAPSRSSPTA